MADGKRRLKHLEWQEFIPTNFLESDSVHLDLGAGNSPRNPFSANKLIATDFHDNFIREDGVEFVKVDLTKTLPFADNSISSCSAYDLLEHIPRWERDANGEIVFPFIQLMSEIRRILKPNGLFVAVTPAYPSTAAFQDPTHINFISRETLIYFDRDTNWAQTLGYGAKTDFEVVYENWQFGTGPFPERLEWSKLQNKSLKLKFVELLKKTSLGFRILKLIKMRILKSHPTHLIWVLRKPI